MKKFRREDLFRSQDYLRVGYSSAVFLHMCVVVGGACVCTCVCVAATTNGRAAAETTRLQSPCFFRVMRFDLMLI